MTYQHRQFGTTMLAGLGIAAGIFLVVIGSTPLGKIGWIPVGIIAAAALLFSSLSIEIADGRLSWRFGPGLIRKHVPIVDITAVEVTRTRFWEGWGIHFTSRGWLYNVSGYDAVLIDLKSGKRFMLGTDEPEALAAALNARII